MDVDWYWGTGGPVLTPGVLELSDQFLSQNVDVDHGLAVGQVRFGLVCQVAELCVTVGMMAALQGLGVGLEAVASLP
jgi:hypothetical protein